MSDLPVVSLGSFQIGSARVAVRRRSDNHAIEVAVMLDGLRDVRSPDGATTTITSIETISARAWELMPPDVRRRLIRDFVHDLVEHELDEWLTFDGERFATPHEGEVPR